VKVWTSYWLRLETRCVLLCTHSDETSDQGADFLSRCHVTKYLTEYMQSNKEPTVLLCFYASVRSDVYFATILYAVLSSGGYMRTTSDGYTFSESDTVYGRYAV
jgi:hypothetical protein